MFDNYIKVDYRRLLSSPSSGAADEMDGSSSSAAPVLTDLGIYEDEESRAAREAATSNWNCPAWAAWCDNLPSLSFRERLLGCVTCMVCGYLMGFGSLIRMQKLVTGNPIPLVVNVTVGNVLTLCGSCFLTGPQQQAKRMFHPTRKIASICYLSSMMITLILVLITPSFPTRGFILCLLLIAQYVAITWYCLSYIPFARDAIKRCCQRMVQQQQQRDDIAGGSSAGLLDG